MAIRNPYAAVDWAGEQIPGLTHEHATTKADFDQLVGAGYKHMGISNYFPSDPTTSYPLTNMIGVTAPDIPADIVACPNAEHGVFTNSSGHMSAVGSLYVGGSGYGGLWQDFVDDVAAAMLYPNAGGIFANHPSLSFMGDVKVKEMLDYSEYFAGIEIFNSLGDWYYGGAGWALLNWHRMLITGRRCYGVGAIDHWTEFGPEGTAVNDSDGNPTTVPPARGFNRLLVPSSFSAMSTADKERECLEAYFEGRFYVALEDSSPAITDIALTSTQLTVTFAESCAISFVWARPNDAAAQTTIAGTGTSKTYTLRGDEVYVRAVGTKSTYEMSLTQPIMFIDQADIAGGDDTKRRLLLLGGGR